ncbi:unnamed protein product [Rotaria sp. Silwood1]|nr:unnamed protein product [Rotaria sp. Silwood1]CAF1270683.1 unnamed protein product [Rotaria sp. Silwood1]CAF3482197.1 unnamed protein product [Rotaria sp. Silwood1]CAF3650734.1 unnamed protein product [Rotaria sp. Silwood1]CAF4669083.1 unnamed protein product [Rotaria sp. Silwood1]
MSHYLISVIIIDTILFLNLLAILFAFRTKKQRLWLYIMLIFVTILITIRNLHLFVSIIYRTVTEFEKKRTFFSDAINRQINFLEEPQHPVWKIILLKQCCGLNSKYSKSNIKEYQWFRQTFFSYFCPDLHLKHDQIMLFEHTFKIKYSPQGLCLPLISHELKIELILISLDLGLGVLLMLLTWLFICQDRLLYLTLLKNKLKKKQRPSIIGTNKSSTTSVIQEPMITEIPKLSTLPTLEELHKPKQLVTMKSSETKRLYKGYLTALEDEK